MKRRNFLKSLGLVIIAPQIGLKMLATINTVSTPMSFAKGTVSYDGGYLVPKKYADELLVAYQGKMTSKTTRISIC